MRPHGRMVIKMTPRVKRVKTRTFVQKHVEEALVKMIIIDELPFSVVEQEGFKQLMEAAFPGFRIPSPEMISRDSSRIFIDEKMKLKSLIKRTNQSVCLSLDTFTSNQSVKYLSITVHFIDNNWNLHKKIIGFTPICSDEGEEIGKVVENCLRDWEINNVVTISTCAGSSNDVAVTYLKGKLPNTILDGRFLFHLKCVAAFSKSLVKDVVEKCEDSITRVRESVRYVGQSPDRIKRFLKCARESLIKSEYSFRVDCPTRWDSTLEMLKASEEFDDIFYWLKQTDPTYKRELKDTCGIPECSDWEKVKKVVTFLEGFYESMENVFKSYVTSNVFLIEVARIDCILDDWGLSVCREFDELLDEALDMTWKHSEYWGDVEDSNMLIYLTCILDPRRKTDFMEFYFMNKSTYKHEYTDNGERLWKQKAEFVISAVYDFFNEYLDKIGSPQQKANFETSGYKNYLYEDTSHIGLFQKHEIGFGGNTDCKTEIDIYLNQDLFDDFNGFDVLLFWRFNSEDFPILSKMAKDVLAIPISVIAPESAFSTNDNRLDDFQSSLSAEIVEGLVCTQDWIRKSRKQIKVDKGLSNLDNFLKGISLKH